MSAPAVKRCGKSVIRLCWADGLRMTGDGCESFSEILHQLNPEFQIRLLLLITMGKRPRSHSFHPPFSSRQPSVGPGDPAGLWFQSLDLAAGIEGLVEGAYFLDGTNFLGVASSLPFGVSAIFSFVGSPRTGTFTVDGISPPFCVSATIPADDSLRMSANCAEAGRSPRCLFPSSRGVGSSPLDRSTEDRSTDVVPAAFV